MATSPEPTAAGRPLPVRALLAPRHDRLALRTLTGDVGLEREIRHATIQRTGLALAGYDQLVFPGRIQVFGGAETEYLASLDPDALVSALRPVLAREPACIIVTRDLDLAPAAVAAARDGGLAVLATPLRSSAFIEDLHDVLAGVLLPVSVERGSLVDVLGVGCLLCGPSGIGKSACLLDLVSRGHRLVADGLVEVRRLPPGVLIGSAPELRRDTVEIHGVGVFSIHALFGAAAVRDRKRLDLVIRFDPPDFDDPEPPSSLREDLTRVFDVEVPRVRLALSPSAVLVETLARNELLRRRGEGSAFRAARRSGPPPEASNGGTGDPGGAVE
jgi:HPr kinase/phosphorylase